MPTVRDSLASVSWPGDLLRDWLGWTALDKALDALTETKVGKALLTFLGGVMLSAVSTAVAYVRTLGPAWWFGSLGALIATVGASAILAVILVRDKRRALPNDARLAPPPPRTIPSTAHGAVLPSERDQTASDHPLSTGWLVQR